MPDEYGADNHLQKINRECDTRVITEDAEEFPHFIILIELCIASLILDNHYQFEDEQGQCTNKHHKAHEPLEFYIGRVVAQN